MGMPVNDALTREFSRRLYKLMTDRGMSQSDLARKIWGETDDPRGFKVAKNRDRTSQYLRGRSLPDPENSLKIAEALGVAVEDLIPGRPGMPDQGADVSVTSIPGTNDVRLHIDRVIPLQLAAEIIQKLPKA